VRNLRKQMCIALPNIVHEADDGKRLQVAQIMFIAHTVGQASTSSECDGLLSGGHRTNRQRSEPVGDDMSEETKRRDNSESLLPIEIVEQASFEDEAALLGHTKGGPIGVYATVAAIALLGGLFAYEQLDTQATHATVVVAVETEVVNALAGFNSCAFSGTAEDQLRFGADVQVAADSFGSRYGRGYAQRLRKCIPKLDRLTASLEKSPVPADMEPSLAAVAGATVQLSEAWTAYRDYLEQGSFDASAAAPRTEAIGAAFTALSEGRQELAAAGGSTVAK